MPPAIGLLSRRSTAAMSWSHPVLCAPTPIQYSCDAGFTVTWLTVIIQFSMAHADDISSIDATRPNHAPSFVRLKRPAELCEESLQRTAPSRLPSARLVHPAQVCYGGRV